MTDQANDNTLLTNLLQLEPSELQRWVHRAQRGEVKVPRTFNWLGLAEVASANATSAPVGVGSSDQIGWAGIAAQVYDWLAGKADSANKESLMVSAMMLRAAMIAKHGSRSGDYLLDADRITRWFFEELPFTYEEAVQELEKWTQRDLDAARQLRRIKNRLSVIQLMANSQQIQPDEELSNWLALSERLP